MAEPTIEQAKASVERIAQGMQESEKAAGGLLDSLLSISRTVLPGFLQVRELFTGSNVGRGLVQTYRAMSKTVEQLTAERQAQFRDLERRLAAEEFTPEVYEQKRRALSDQVGLFEKQLDVSREAARLGTAQLVTAKLLVLEAGKLLALSRQLNQNLIEADASAGHRLRLMYDTLDVMRTTGASFQQATNISRALVKYGLDNNAAYKDLGARIQMMNEGLGLSVDLATELAAIAENRLHFSFAQLGDTIATLVDSTSLAADEAGRLAVNLSRAMTTLGPGIDATALPQITQLIGGYESALKELGGQSGTVQQLLTRLTTTEGLAAGGALGVYSPEFIATEQGAEAVLDRFHAYAENFIGQAQGWDRRMRLEALAQLFGTTADQAQLLIQAIERRREQETKAVTLEERYRKQLHATSDAIGRAYSALISLVHGALYPVVWTVSKALSLIADGLQFIASWKPTAYTAMVALAVGIGYVTFSMARLTRALLASAVAASRATIEEARLAASRAGGSAAGGLFSATSWRALAARMGVAVSTLGVIAAGITAISAVLVGWAIWERQKAKEAAEQARQARLGSATVATNLANTYKSMVGLAAREGDKARMDQVLQRLDADLPKMIPHYDELSPGQKLKEREQVLQSMLNIANLAQQGRRLFYTEIGASEREADKNTRELQEQVLRSQKEQTKVVVEEWKEQQRAREAAKEAGRRATLRHIDREMGMGVR